MGRLLELSTPVASILSSSQTPGISIVYIVGICCSLPKLCINYETYGDLICSEVRVERFFKTKIAKCLIVLNAES